MNCTTVILLYGSFLYYGGHVFGSINVKIFLMVTHYRIILNPADLNI